MVVTGIRDGAAQQILIFIHTLDKCRQKQQKPGILIGRLSGAEQILAAVGGQ